MKFKELIPFKDNIKTMFMLDAFKTSSMYPAGEYTGVSYMSQLLMFLLSQHYIREYRGKEYSVDAYTYMTSWFNSAALQPYILKDAPTEVRKVAVTRTALEFSATDLLLTNFIAFLSTSNENLMCYEIKNDALLFQLSYIPAACSIMLAKAALLLKNNPQEKIQFDDLVAFIPEDIRKPYLKESSLVLDDYGRICEQTLKIVLSLIKLLQEKDVCEEKTFYHFMAKIQMLNSRPASVLAGFFLGFYYEEIDNLFSKDTDIFMEADYYCHILDKLFKFVEAVE